MNDRLTSTATLLPVLDSPQGLPPEQATEEALRRAAERFDAGLQARAATLWGGLSPVALHLALTDWALHLATQPADALRLGLTAWQRWQEAAGALLGGVAPAADGRFEHPGWRQWPFSAWAHLHQAAEAWWAEAAALRGMSRHHREMSRFFAARWLDALSPSNRVFANPELIARARDTFGTNLLEGAARAVALWQRQHACSTNPADVPWQPGRDVAITPGKVVYRNRLIELIQYLPLTAAVQREPVLIVPSWIMKYYILDLAPSHSLVRWLVAQGHTVFMISWRNPDASDAGLSLQDYLDLGVFDALAAIARQYPDTRVHTCGYCLGGTLLAVAAAALCAPRAPAEAGKPEQQISPVALASVTLLATETDFTEPGELGLLIDEDQVALLENIMAERGFLTGRQMAGTFTFLHARDLFWNHHTRTVWLGDQDTPTDLMAWNADVTRMPAAMHSEYLRRCYLRNEIAEGRFPVHGRPVSLEDIDVPMFVVGTEKDHVSPWHSVFKIHRLTRADLTFVLVNGGHNAGIISEPGHPHRHHAVGMRPRGEPSRDPGSWLAASEHREGSWWTTWHAWLVAHGDPRTVKARTPPAQLVLEDAPGSYVHLRYDD